MEAEQARDNSYTLAELTQRITSGQGQTRNTNLIISS